ncbi:hypothetical protein NUW58_g7200 [Xylaria curta]|uniref:Uncharacterized protein n=1 Tax=Xylaria curta TaxID=42375 RepID=A0ACC1NKG5_9PEZI|nr:hypothetical protein NUW58_g7200 [Xylaria curta]
MAPVNNFNSRARSMTLRQEDVPAESSIRYEMQTNRDGPEKVDDQLLIDPDDDNSAKRLILSIDFGTTYSAVSYVPLSENQSPDGVSSIDILSIENYPGDKNREAGSQMKKEVPTEVMYPSDPNFREGANLSRVNMTGGIVAESDEEPRQDDDDVMEVDAGGYNIPMLVSNSGEFKWGYKMHEAWAKPTTHFRQTSRAMNRFKLLLDRSPQTEIVRRSLRPTLKYLTSNKIVESEVGVIADFLTCLLRHVKSQLQSLRLYDDYRVEMVLCVPAIWTQKACRDMQAALLTAMMTADFKGVDWSCQAIENLFIVSEPEAAAAFILDTDPDIQAGQSFVLLDAGGGTVDANTYMVSQTQPLRLSEEIVLPGGALCGSSYLNEAFRIMLLERLKSEDYLEHGRVTLEGIVENIMMNEFEYKTKRQFDIYDKQKMHETYYCAGLGDDEDKGFWDSLIIVRHDQMKAIFMPVLEKIAEVLDVQIESARQKGIYVNKVILVGGFAGSPSLRGYLKRRLQTIERGLPIGIEIEWVVRENRVAAVASGAVLRALNKDNGPRRLIRSSYGIRRDEPKYRGSNRGAFRDPADGLWYKRTIYWILQRTLKKSEE